MRAVVMELRTNRTLSLARINVGQVVIVCAYITGDITSSIETCAIL